jgi:hypothetical protein
VKKVREIAAKEGSQVITICGKIESEIAALESKEEKEALHQRNRRTVFRILNWDYQDPNAPKSNKPVYKPQVSGEENSEEVE